MTDPALDKMSELLDKQTELLRLLVRNQELANRDQRAQDYFDQMTEANRKLDAVRSILSAAEPDQPEHEIRWARAFLAGREFPAITPEEPEPERDWSKVRAHLHKPSGKWMYQVWLDYTGERWVHGGKGPEGPAGWHFDGSEMAKRALARATDNGTSEVSIRELGDHWHLFVPDPPQGYPIWVQPAGATLGLLDR